MKRLTRTAVVVLSLAGLGACASDPPPPDRVSYVPEAPCTRPARDGRCDGRIDKPPQHSKYWFGDYF